MARKERASSTPIDSLKHAEKRRNIYVQKHSMKISPDSEDPLKDKPFTLAAALAGVAGAGPLEATISTTAGDIICRLYDKDAPEALAVFVGLARGLRPWWDPGRGTWSHDPFYKGTPLYNVQKDEAIFGGCPTGNGSDTVGVCIVPATGTQHSGSGCSSLCVQSGRRCTSRGG
jgi:peptidyl-prolyl cis-trans isomerase A (cyclophilin A)